MGRSANMRYCTADQRLCFHKTDSITIPLLLKFEISSFQPASVIVQTGVCHAKAHLFVLLAVPHLGFQSGGFVPTLHVPAHISYLYTLRHQFE